MKIKKYLYSAALVSVSLIVLLTVMFFYADITNVEAACAGKYGKGFAVVAEEVRSLANRSSEAVNNTSAKVVEMLKGIKQSYVCIRKFFERVEIIGKDSNGLFDVSAQIAQSVREQSESLSQIKAALVEIEKDVQSNTAISEESDAQIRELVRYVHAFKV